MFGPRNPDPTPETAEPRTDLRTTDEKPAKVHTATPSNVPQTAGPASPDGPSREETSRRAYELYQKRGGMHGRHEEDWYEAERQLRTERQRRSGGAPETSAAKTTAKKSAAKKATAKKSAAKKATAKTAGGAKKTTGGKG